MCVYSLNINSVMIKDHSYYLLTNPIILYTCLTRIFKIKTILQGTPSFDLFLLFNSIQFNSLFPSIKRILNRLYIQQFKNSQ